MPTEAAMKRAQALSDWYPPEVIETIATAIDAAVEEEREAILSSVLLLSIASIGGQQMQVAVVDVIEARGKGRR